MKIAIKFHDNDFGNTFSNVLKVLHQAYLHTESLSLNKERLSFIISSLVIPIYLTHQHQGSNDNLSISPEEETRLADLKNYLYIAPEKILINEEVDEYLKTTEWNNGETFILDTSLNYPGNSVVYSI